MKFLHVLTTSPKQVQAYLYGANEILSTWPDVAGRTSLLVVINESGGFGAEPQRDRLMSGCHGAKIVTLSEIETLARESSAATCAATDEWSNGRTTWGEVTALAKISDMVWLAYFDAERGARQSA